MVSIADRSEIHSVSFNAIRISIASPEQIRSWSHGRVSKPETINYRTLRPEKDGLFCERIFGPTKDWECFCGKYKRIRYRGVICDRCGVEVTRSRVRRERMGHIELAAPVAHIWFSKGTPSRLGLLLDLSPRNLERVLYFARHLIISVDDDARADLKEARREEQEAVLEEKRQPAAERVGQILGRDVTPDEVLDEDGRVDMDRIRQLVKADDVIDAALEDAAATEQEDAAAAPEGEPATAASPSNERADERADERTRQLEEFKESHDKDLTQFELEYETWVDDLDALRALDLVTERKFRELRDRYGDVFEAGMGAEAALEILRRLDLETLRERLLEEMQSTSGQRHKKAIKRLRVVEAFRKSGNRVEWLILKVLPVLPPELRPMVQLDGGRFATSDLNDLYRRVINRNNRLKRLMDLGAPEIIVRNEKRMLQEAVDALIDNGRRGRPIRGSHNHQLKSLSDLLKGKQGRFRQNLLGKRVDYSGRSVIVAGPDLELHQCGLPKRMALELFKPFVMHRLALLGIVPNIKSAKRMVERARGEVWDILEEVIKERPVLINRAPTLHRLGIQAFMPVLIEGSAIQIHPLVCPAFNADFDGDQMAVHVPLSRMAVMEAKETMISVHNMLSPASGEPLVAPTLDMVLGCFYLTDIRERVKGSGQRFRDFEEATMAFDSGLVDIQAEVKIWRPEEPEGWLSTSVGRIIFNDVLPPEVGFKNQVMDRGALKDLTSECYRVLGNRATAKVLDRVKTLGFHYATVSGITIGINDIHVSPRKEKIIEAADRQVKTYENDYMQGLMTEDERYEHTISAWTAASDEMEQIVKDEMDSYGGIAVMARSGAKGNIAQIKQMAGMRGLMSNPKGRIIDLPIKSSFREGLTALEYFISTHGARKGLADTALRTADSGYLTRRLTDVCQDVIILEDDCGVEEGIWLEPDQGDPLVASQKERALGRMAAAPVADPKTGEILVDRNQEIDEQAMEAIKEAGVERLHIRSPLTCQAQRGLCQLCYGRSPATGRIVQKGEAVGIIAAQSIGEPGTQLTMRTFHTGGVVGLDITSGLPKVVELFEARRPKMPAIMTDIDGVAEIQEDSDGRRVRIISKEEYREDYELPPKAEMLVEDGQEVAAGSVLAAPKAKGKKKEPEEGQKVVANVGGVVEIQPTGLSITWTDEEVREYAASASALLLVKDGDEVKTGAALTAGPLDPHEILRIRGKEDLQLYLIDEVQRVYRSQGVSIHNKHIEVVVRQMLRRVQVDSAGDAEYIPGQSIDLFDFQQKNTEVLAEGGEPATAKTALLGVTRSSLLTDSFLAAASFQETARVLTEASASGAVDRLRGLKENVIIGRLIPARVDIDLPPMEEQFMLGDELGIEGPDDAAFAAALIRDVTEDPPFTNGHEEMENGLGEGGIEGEAVIEVEGEPPEDALAEVERQDAGDALEARERKQEEFRATAEVEEQPADD